MSEATEGSSHPSPTQGALTCSDCRDGTQREEEITDFPLDVSCPFFPDSVTSSDPLLQQRMAHQFWAGGSAAINPQQSVTIHRTVELDAISNETHAPGDALEGSDLSFMRQRLFNNRRDVFQTHRGCVRGKQTSPGI